MIQHQETQTTCPEAQIDSEMRRTNCRILNKEVSELDTGIKSPREHRPITCECTSNHAGRNPSVKFYKETYVQLECVAFKHDSSQRFLVLEAQNQQMFNSFKGSHSFRWQGGVAPARARLWYAPAAICVILYFWASL